MPLKASQTRLTARQRLGWLAILLLMIASLAALIWRSKPAPQPPQVLEWPIAPIVADSANAKNASDGRPKAKNDKKHKRKRRKPETTTPKPADMPRDITKEDVTRPQSR